MKKITVVVGSMRKGNSALIGDKLKSVITNTKVFTLGSNIHYCTGCLECDETHKCNISDDMDFILPSIVESDILIIVTPVRYSLMSGDVKVFIDRLNPTAVSEELCGKKLIAIAVGQTDEEEGSVQDSLSSLQMFANNAGMQYMGGYPIFSCYGNDDLAKKENEINDVIKWVKEKLDEL